MDGPMIEADPGDSEPRRGLERARHGEQIGPFVHIPNTQETREAPHCRENQFDIRPLEILRPRVLIECDGDRAFQLLTAAL